MRAFSILSAAFLFVATALGIAVTNPAQGTRWDAGKKTQSVAWTSVATDPTSFTIALVNMQAYPNINIVLKENVVTSAGSTTVDAPSLGWPTGNGFQINLVQQNPTGVAILAQSQQFNITGTTTPFQPTQSSTSFSVASTNTAHGAFSSDASPTDTSSPSETNSVHSGSSNDAMGLTIRFDFVVGLALVGALLA
ncbi:hypothetical protein BDM02DRAFT_3191395 [Thelephora ganbajun]|uniref:Uncharacterized protein n=1 Tax=Thelephora ganbajun TaxID=370292 RepID=A0ACB6Z270_THEGA|nr:hypothetical protein BDM02DRAFT_3191395 [Thelephora ganbajun]